MPKGKKEEHEIAHESSKSKEHGYESDTVTIKRDYIYIGIIVILIAALLFVYMGQQKPNQNQGTTGQDLGQNNQLPIIDSVIDNDPRIGSNNAPVVIIEFSDFQCQYCRAFYTQTFQALKTNYIDKGKVQLVYRDFPLSSLHPAAQKSAEAAECAHEQGKFLEMHNKIFDEQNKISGGALVGVNYGVEDLKKWAAEIGLDTARFNQCLDSGKYADEVQKDFQDGVNLGVQGTPTFYIAKRGQRGTLIVGARPYEVFQQEIDRLLSK
jgi:protein-disulfide isomerase